MGFLSRLIGFFLLIFLLVLVGHMGSEGFEVFVNLPSLALVSGIFVLGMVCSFSLPLIFWALAAAVCDEQSVEADKYPQYAAVLDRAHQLAWVAGFLAAMIGTVQIVSTLSSPDMMMGGIVVVLLPLLYGVLLAELLVGPLKHSLLASYLGAGGTADKLPPPQRRVVVGFVVVACCFILAAALLYFIALQGGSWRASLVPYQ